MMDMIWLKAEYSFAGLYSCRMPGSGMTPVPTMPAPGPATVRLALVRVAIELFGVNYTRDIVFPVIRAAEVAISPPQPIAISTHKHQIYKPRDSQSGPARLDETLGLRDQAHSAGTLRIYLRVAGDRQSIVAPTLQSIGYWGQRGSMVTCLSVDPELPPLGFVAVSMKKLGFDKSVGHYACLVPEFRDNAVSWDEVTSEKGGHDSDFLRYELFVWPLAASQPLRGGWFLTQKKLEI